MTVLALAVCLSPYQAAAAEQITTKPPWMSKFAWAVGVCETGKGHRYPDFHHHAGSYQGFVGWFKGTWLLDRPKGAPDNAYAATPKQQYRAFLTGRARGRYWGCIANGGYRSWL